ncbi:MAG TPA: CHRD domain-containing protein [Rhizomicrobium sp.]|nr:CHRD domain-containing protein [Rhizomicrobium sp.]
MSRHKAILICAAAALLWAAPAWAANFEAQLDPAPFNATSRAIVIESEGQVTATLEGRTLSVRGTFSNLSSPATAASFRIGLAKGVLGDAIGGTLTVTPATQGSVEGSIKLTSAQLAALNQQSLYIRIDSEKAPDGHLQGWLEPAGSN